MERKKIVAGNWKMHAGLEQAKKLTSEVVNMVKDEVMNDTEVVLIPTAIAIPEVIRLCKGSNIKVGAQNCHQSDKGAFTGEISAEILSSFDVQYVIIGHSERRQYYHESNQLLAQKVVQALANGLIPIYCCGETLEQRESGNHELVNLSQIKEGLYHLSPEDFAKVVIAYEPVWAIGTGKTASAEQAQEIHHLIRTDITATYGQQIAQNCSILYGGSVKPNNANELFAMPDIDGGLIGGAALHSRDFTDIIKAFG